MTLLYLIIWLNFPKDLLLHLNKRRFDFSLTGVSLHIYFSCLVALFLCRGILLSRLFSHGVLFCAEFILLSAMLSIFLYPREVSFKDRYLVKDNFHIW